MKLDKQATSVEGAAAGCQTGFTAASLRIAQRLALDSQNIAEFLPSLLF